MTEISGPELVTAERESRHMFSAMVDGSEGTKLLTLEGFAATIAHSRPLITTCSR